MQFSSLSSPTYLQGSCATDLFQHLQHSDLDLDFDLVDSDSKMSSRTTFPPGDGFFSAATDSDVETPKASQENLSRCPTLSTSIHSSASTASTALPSPELTGPATNFGVVRDGCIYRSGFPKIPNFEHMASLGLKTILTLVDQPYPVENQQFISDHKIMHVRLPLPAHKDAFASIPVDLMQRALSIIMDSRNWPILIHCNKGKHRTGCVVACYRKINDWSMDEIVQEYRHYAAAKARALDETYIKLFDEDSMKDTIECSLPGSVGQQALSRSAPARSPAFPNRTATV